MSEPGPEPRSTMPGRLRTLNWRYAVGEIAIVVIGILIAIALDNWRDARVEDRLEAEYLKRLKEDLIADTATYSFVDRAIDRKIRFLSLADSVLSGTSVLRDTLGFLQAVVAGSNFAWNQPSLRTTTFEDLQGTGNLRLISNPELRANIVRYYTSADGDYDRIRSRRTRYGPMSYELLPRQEEFVLDTAAVVRELPRLTRAVMTSELASAIVAERNFAQFFRSMITMLRQRALDLLKQLD
jgi:hypothetical protein